MARASGRTLTNCKAQLCVIDDIVHAVAECGGDACSVQGTALLLHAVSAWRIWSLTPETKMLTSFFPRTKMSKTKMLQHFFSWVETGCDRPFFRSYRRSEILSVSARSFATTSDMEALYFFLFLSGHEKVLIGLACFDKQTPQNRFEPPLKGKGYSLYLIHSEY